MKNKIILIDASYIKNIESLKKSIALYLMRFLDNLNDTEQELKLICRRELYDFFYDKYNSRFSEIIVFEQNMKSKVGFIQSLMDAFSWKKNVNKIKADVVYIPYTWIWNSLKINKIKVITIHDLKPMKELMGTNAKKLRFLKPLILSIFKIFYKTAIKNASEVIAITEYVKNDIIKQLNIKSNKIKVIYDCVAFETIKKQEVKELQDKKFILCVNTIDQFKNTITLIKAFLALDNKDYYLVLVGKETSYWREVCLPLVNEHVIRLNYVTEEELSWLYEKASLFVTPSLREGLGITPIEAAVRNCPVISSKSEALPEATMGLVYYYEPATDDNALCEKIDLVLRQRDIDPEFNNKMNKIGDEFRTRYSVHEFPKNILSILLKG